MRTNPSRPRMRKNEMTDENETTETSRADETGKDGTMNRWDAEANEAARQRRASHHGERDENERTAERNGAHTRRQAETPDETTSETPGNAYEKREQGKGEAGNGSG